MKTNLTQKGFFFSENDDLFHATHIEQLSVDLKGIACMERFRKALKALVESHSILRTSFHLKDKTLTMMVHESLSVLPLDERDLSSMPVLHHNEFIRAEEKSKLNNTFDLSQPPLFNVTIYRKSKDDFRLTIIFHHMITDGWSLFAFAYELIERYCTNNDNVVSCKKTVLNNETKNRDYETRSNLILAIPYDQKTESIPIYNHYLEIYDKTETEQFFLEHSDLSPSQCWFYHTGKWLFDLTGSNTISFYTPVNTRKVTTDIVKNFSLAMGCFISLQKICLQRNSSLNLEDQLKKQISAARERAQYDCSNTEILSKQIITTFLPMPSYMPIQKSNRDILIKGVFLKNTTGFDISLQGWMYEDQLHIGWNYRYDRFSNETIQRFAKNFGRTPDKGKR